MVQVEAEGDAAEVLCFYDSLLVCIFDACVETGAVVASAYRGVVVLYLCRTENHALSVVGLLLLGCSQTSAFLRSVGHEGWVATVVDPGFVQYLCGLRTRSKIPQLGSLGKAEFRIQGYSRLLVSLASLGRHQDDTVGTTGSIYSGSAGILQHLDVLDVVGVEVREWIDGLTAVRDGLKRCGINRHTVDDVQRVVAGIDRGCTAQADKCCRTRSSR